MESDNNSEIKGNLRHYSLAELLAETGAAKLSGSFRLENEKQKSVIYLRNGKVVFIASNSREHRLFEKLLSDGKITKKQILAIENFTNDLQFRQTLIEKNIFSPKEIDKIISLQIEEVLWEMLLWIGGKWTFSHLARIREDIEFEINTNQLLLDYSRELPVEDAAGKIAEPHQTFGLNPSPKAQLDLLPNEAFLLSRFEKSFLSFTEINQISGLPEDLTKKYLYVLWLGGFIFRQNWKQAFSEKKISEILSAKISLKDSVEQESVKTEAAAVSVEPEQNQPETVKVDETIEKKAVNQPLKLDDYLERIANSTNYYELFDIVPDSSVAEIKHEYLNIAKNFHPDIFYKKVELEVHQKIQSAFTKVAQAYETLKDEKSRQIYDYKMRKVLEEMKQFKEQGFSEDEIDIHKQRREAEDLFQKGFDYLLNEELEKAVAFLSRAAHLAEENGRYHAYFGKALSFDKAQQHKAVAEMQTAVKLEPENASYKLMLAELFIQIGLRVRAKGELTRLIQQFPDNAEAKKLLDNL